MRYCIRCVMPDTKPDLRIDSEGVCSACRNYEKRMEIAWDTRRVELEQILDRYRSKSGTNWDCIVPVSGGKDSTSQVIRVLQLGLNPRSFAVMITLGASCSFLTPLEPSCMMVYGPGNYRFVDFLKVGMPLTVFIFFTALVMVPVIWPL